MVISPNWLIVRFPVCVPLNEIYLSEVSEMSNPILGKVMKDGGEGCKRAGHIVSVVYVVYPYFAAIQLTV